MTATAKAYAIIKRIRRANTNLTEREAVELALIFADEMNSQLWDLEPKVDEDLWLYREMRAVNSYWKEVERALKAM